MRVQTTVGSGTTSTWVEFPVRVAVDPSMQTLRVWNLRELQLSGFKLKLPKGDTQQNYVQLFKTPPQHPTPSWCLPLGIWPGCGHSVHHVQHITEAFSELMLYVEDAVVRSAAPLARDSHNWTIVFIPMGREPAVHLPKFAALCEVLSFQP